MREPGNEVVPFGILSLLFAVLFFIFSCTVFFNAPQLTEHLEKATPTLEKNQSR